MNMKKIPLVVGLSFSMLCGVSLVGCNTIKTQIEDMKTISLPDLPKDAKQVQHLKLLESHRLKGANVVDPLNLQVASLTLATGEKRYFGASRQGMIEAFQISPKYKTIWEREYPKTISGGVAVSKDVLVLGTDNGQLLALDPNNGAVKWSKQLGASLLSVPLIVDQVVVSLASNGLTVAYDASTGKQLWAYNVPTASTLNVRGNASPILFDEDVVILTSATGRILGLKLKTGELVFEHRVAVTAKATEMDRLIDLDGEPLVVGRSIFTASYQGQLTASDLDAGRKIWQKDTSTLRALSQGLGNVYVSTTDAKVVAYDQRTGELQWTVNFNPRLVLSNPVVLGRYLVVGDQLGNLHLIEQVEGKVVGREHTRGAIKRLAVSDSDLMVESATGNISIWQAQ